MSVAIKVENLSKAYQLGQFGTGTLSHDLNRWWALKRGKQDPYLKIGEENNRSSKGESNVVWSLKDINFEIEQGSAVGIIGKNGAGKSTLLKILSQVTAPTYGKIGIKGRIASLLEVGTGFHPELSGRENIYLNGAILGMRKSEIDRKFDQIVDFAGVERYIDTPVKRYSSGMYVRLAFGVAAHLESEILIVDEVLAVGDAEFQKKCIGKMSEISVGEGRTIIFVSHNMAAITNLCSTGIHIENGKLSSYGNIGPVVQKYISSNVSNDSVAEFPLITNSAINITKVWLTTDLNVGSRNFCLGDTININFELYNTSNLNMEDIQVAIQITASDGVKICNIIDKDSEFRLNSFTGKINVSVSLTDIRLYPDIYFVSIWVGTRITSIPYDFKEDCLSFEILNGGKLTSRELPRSAGLFFLNPNWNCYQK